MEIGKKRHPQRPANLPKYSEACLQALAAHGLAKANKHFLGGLGELLFKPGSFVPILNTKFAKAREARPWLKKKHPHTKPASRPPIWKGKTAKSEIAQSELQNGRPPTSDL
jgi:hypothetical protein